jgi:serine/threonine protein kinase
VDCPSCRAANVADAMACVGCGTSLPPTATQVIVTVDLRPGVVFDSRYEIVALLGQGGMGMVYQARDRSLDEVVAIKILRPDFAQDPRMGERFKSEIRLARRVRHKNVCAIHDYGEDQGLFYISMEFVDGVDLKRLLRDRGPFPADQGYEVAIQIAEGLQAVHEAGIIHRDLKTPNIMRDGSGATRLMDFGIAKREGDGARTATGHIVGTPEYMSPEQAQGHRVGPASDIYALGIVVYEIFTGRVPFRGETPISTILKHLHDAPPLDLPDAAAIPTAVREVLRRCLAKVPGDRYASAAEVAEALRDARSPSRRQQPVPTSALQAPTVETPTLAATARAMPPAPPPPESAPARRMQLWLLVIPLMAVGVGAFALRPMQRAAPSESPAFASPASVAAAALAQPSPVPPVLFEESTTAARVPPPPVTLAPVTRRPAAALRPAPSNARPLAAPPAATAPAVTMPPAAAAAPVPPATVAEPGQLQVAVRPWGEVSVDGRLIGTTPLDRITLPAGSHVLRIRHPLYETWERPIAIRPGETAKVVVDLPTDGVRKQP